MIRIIIADDQPIIRHGLRYVIGLDSELKLVEEAVDGIDLIDKMEQQSCDVILMDIRMPRMDGVEATLQPKNRMYGHAGGYKPGNCFQGVCVRGNCKKSCD